MSQKLLQEAWWKLCSMSAWDPLLISGQHERRSWEGVRGVLVCAAHRCAHDGRDMAPAQHGLAADLHPTEDPRRPHGNLLGSQVRPLSLPSAEHCPRHCCSGTSSSDGSADHTTLSPVSLRRQQSANLPLLLDVSEEAMQSDLAHCSPMLLFPARITALLSMV